MISLRKVRVYMRKRNLIPIIDVVQLDTGIRMVLEVADETIPAGSTATAYFEKPSGKWVQQSASVSANTITINVRNEAFQEAGNVTYQVELSGSDGKVTTFAGTIAVQRKKSESATQSETVLPALEEAAQKAIEDVRKEASELVKTDETLTQDGKAADAGATGRAIKAMAQDIGLSVVDGKICVTYETEEDE